MLIGSKNDKTPVGNERVETPQCEETKKVFLSAVDFRSRQTRSAGTASISLSQASVVSQMLLKTCGFTGI